MWKLTKWLRIITAEDSFFLIYWNPFDDVENLFFLLIYHFFLFWRQSRKRRQFPFCRLCVATSKFNMRVNIYAIAYYSGVSYYIIFSRSRFWSETLFRYWNLTSVYMCIGYVCGCGWDREDERLTWNGGAEYMDTQQRCPLQICRRETRLLDVCGKFNKFLFTYLTLSYWKCY